MTTELENLRREVCELQVEYLFKLEALNLLLIDIAKLTELHKDSLGFYMRIVRGKNVV